MRVIDLHIHVQPFHMLKPDVRATFWKTPEDAAAAEAMAADPRVLLARMDADGIEQVGLINYVSPDVMGFTDECNEWMVRYASAAPDRFIPFGSVQIGRAHV